MTQRPFEEFDQERLDQEYSPSSLVDDLDRHLVGYAEASSIAIAAAYDYREAVYGDGSDRHEHQRIAFFGVPTGAPPLLVFIHGGYWQQHSHLDSCFAAPQFTSRGIAFAAIGYSLAPDAAMDDIVADCRAALVWLYKHAAEFGFDATRIHLAGTSAGAQLAARMTETDWRTYHVPSTLLASVMLVSGVFDLEPIRRSYVNEVLALDHQSAARNSPLLHRPINRQPTLIAWAERDTAEFKRQSADYLRHCAEHGQLVVGLECPSRHHFDVILDLGDVTTELGRAAELIMCAAETKSGRSSPNGES